MYRITHKGNTYECNSENFMDAVYYAATLECPTYRRSSVTFYKKPGTPNPVTVSLKYRKKGKVLSKSFIVTIEHLPS